MKLHACEKESVSLVPGSLRLSLVSGTKKSGSGTKPRLREADPNRSKPASSGCLGPHKFSLPPSEDAPSEKEGGELEERTEEGTEEREERIEDREEGLEVTEEACKEDDRCEEESECHSAAKRARVCATFTDSQENAIVEFVKEHPELYDKEHGRFHDRHRKEALWAEISAELKLQPFDVRRWFESQRTRYGKLSKLQSGQAPREMTKRQSWVYQDADFRFPAAEVRQAALL